MSGELLTYYNFYLNSRIREYGSPANWTVTLSDPITKNGIIPSEFRMKILSAQIPFSFNQINSFNSTTYFNVSRGPNDYFNQSFTLQSGNYTAITFAQEWINQIKAATLSIAGYSPDFNIVYSNDRNLYSITLTDDGTYQKFTFLNQDTTTNNNYKQINLSLGFPEQWGIGGGETVISTQSINVSPSRNLYIQSDSFAQHDSYDGYVTNRRGQIRTSNVLEVVPITCVPFQYINHQPPLPTESILKNDVIDTVNFSLGDESLDIDLPDFTLNWSIHFLIEEYATNPAISLPVQPNEEALQQAQQELMQQLQAEREQVIQQLQNYKDRLAKSVKQKEK